MPEKIDFKDIIGNLEIIKKLYDIVRIVDPVNKNELVYDKEEACKVEGIKCFDFWNTGDTCQNCISMRAYNENDTFIKIEYNGDKIFMITAMPFDLKDRRVVVEMLKDITDKGIVEYRGRKNAIELYKLFGEKNREAVTDELTQVYNRRYINEMLPYKIIDNSVKKRYVTVIMADIDFFKTINDSYGHLAGDFVLKEFTRVIKSSIRENSDWCARFGGEEFLIFLDNANPEISVEIAEKMRIRTQEHDFLFEDKNIKITSSFGVHTVFCRDIATDKLIGTADKNLYTAKHSGRNRIVATSDISG